MHTRNPKTLAEYDASDLIGINTIIRNAAIEITEDDGDISIEIPNIETASVAAAMSRCLMPVRILAHELRTIRHIVGMTAAELGRAMDPKTSPETVSRWENGKQPMGGYAEKVFRLIVCERLKEHAPGVDYTDGAIAKLKVMDPWRAKPDYKVPPVVLERVRVRSDHRETVSAWAELDKAA